MRTDSVGDSMMALPLIVSVSFLSSFFFLSYLLIFILSFILFASLISFSFTLFLSLFFPTLSLSLSIYLSIYLSVSHTLSSSSPQLSGDNIQNRQMSIDQLQTMQVIRGKRTNLGGEDGNHQGLFHAAPGRPRKADKVSWWALIVIIIIQIGWFYFFYLSSLQFWFSVLKSSSPFSYFVTFHLILAFLTLLFSAIHLSLLLLLNFYFYFYSFSTFLTSSLPYFHLPVLLYIFPFFSILFSFILHAFYFFHLRSYSTTYFFNVIHLTTSGIL